MRNKPAWFWVYVGFMVFAFAEWAHQERLVWKLWDWFVAESPISNGFYLFVIVASICAGALMVRTKIGWDRYFEYMKGYHEGRRDRREEDKVVQLTRRQKKRRNESWSR